MTSTHALRRAVQQALFKTAADRTASTLVRRADSPLAAAVVAAGALLGASAAGIGLMALSSSPAFAQAYTSVDLSGTVVDQTGKPVVGAEVAVTSDQGTVRKATTNANGQFRLLAMPTGDYKATISAGGHNSLTDQAIRVSPSTSAYAFTLVQSGVTLGEVVVSAARVVQDFNRTDSGLTVDVQEMAERIPLGRSITASVALAPTVGLADPSIVANGVRRNQNAVTVSGTSAAESVYYINGLNVTDQRTFLGYSDLPFEAIKSIEVKTGGYQAEYGRGTGGIVNIVTRSGSNDFHFGVSAFWTPDELRADRPTTFRPGGNNSVGIIDKQETVEVDFAEQTIWVSGPVIEDHLFVFALINPRQSDVWGAAAFATPTTNNGTWLNTQFDDPRWLVKVDYVINENHRLEGTIFSDEETTHFQPYNYGKAEGRILPVAGLTNPDGSLLPYDQQSGGTNSILQYVGTFTEHFTLSALIGRTKSSYKDSGPNIELPGIVDFGTTGSSVTLGRQGGPFNFEGEDTRDTYRIDGDIYFDAAGKHHVRVGYDYEDLTSTAISAYSGGALYYGYAQADCPPGASANGCVEKLTFANVGEFSAIQSALYVQDSWEIMPNLAVQVGVRADIYDYKNVDGKSYIKIDDQYAPRLGVTWDPFGTGQNQVFASFGDYYLPIATNTSIRASSGEIYTDQYFQTTRVGGNLVIDSRGYPVMGAQIGQTDYFSPPGAPDPRSVIEEGLDPMYEREFSIGFKHDFVDNFLDGWSAGIRYTQRELQSTIEDTAIGDAILRYCQRNNIASCVNTDPGLYPYVLINPGDAARVFIDLEGDSRANPDGSPNAAYQPQWIDLTKDDLFLNEANRTYRAVELTFERPFNGTWGFQGSYTWSRSKGNYEGAVKSDIGQTDTSITQDFDHAATGYNAYGYLPNHREHQFKLYGTWAPIERFTVGTNIIVQSGRPYGCIGYVPVTQDGLAPNSGTPSGWYCPQGAPLAQNATGALAQQLAAAGLPPTRYASVPTNRGDSGETDWVYQMDLSFGYKVFESDTAGTASILVDIFNVFDGDAVTRVVEQGETRTAATGVKNVPAAYYGQPRTYQAPRSVRLGFRYEF